MEQRHISKIKYVVHYCYLFSKGVLSCLISCECSCSRLVNNKLMFHIVDNVIIKYVGSSKSL